MTAAAAQLDNVLKTAPTGETSKDIAGKIRALKRCTVNRQQGPHHSPKSQFCSEHGHIYTVYPQIKPK